MTRQVNVIAASTITPKRVEWLDEQRVPLGKLTVIAGRPGLGKSLWTNHLAACVTNGCLRGDLTHTPSRVLLASAEDDPEDTIVPRLMAHRADLALVGLLNLTHTDETGAIVPGSTCRAASSTPTRSAFSPSTRLSSSSTRPSKVRITHWTGRCS